MSKNDLYIIQWIDFAKADLKAAKLLYENEIDFHIVVFLSQQACEKIIKALLISRSIPFRKTHDLNSLISLIEDQPFFTTRLYDAVEIFEKFGVEIRYPDPEIIPTKNDTEEAIRNADYIVEYFIKQIDEK